MMNNCRRCGKLYAYTGKPICQECLEKDEQDFKIVKEYIYDHPKCSMDEVVEGTGVSPKKIMRFLKDERLEIVEGMSNLLTCESCGRYIKTGRYCEECLKKFNKSISEVSKSMGFGKKEEHGHNSKDEKSEEEEKEEKNGMYIRHNN